MTSAAPTSHRTHYRAERLQLGDRLFVAVPAEQAGHVAYVLAHGAQMLRQRDGIGRLEWLDDLLAALAGVHREASSEHRLSATGSATRTDPPATVDMAPPWLHDHISTAEGSRLTGWSASYLARLGRRGLGVKHAGAWHLDRRALLALHADRQRRRVQ